eukprot:gene10607-2729_t
MANQTVRDARAIHGTNPQFIVDKIIRSRIYETIYWKEQCFALTAETVIEKAVELQYIGGVHGGNIRPTPFLCLTLKLLQLQPDKDIVVEYIKNEDFKYLRALGAFYLRITGSSLDCYRYLEPLLSDYRKVKRMNRSGMFELTYMDDFIDELLREERSCDIGLPRLQKRYALELNDELEPRRSLLEDELDLEAEIKPSSEDQDEPKSSQRDELCSDSDSDRHASPLKENCTHFASDRQSESDSERRSKKHLSHRHSNKMRRSADRDDRSNSDDRNYRRHGRSHSRDRDDDNHSYSRHSSGRSRKENRHFKRRHRNRSRDRSYDRDDYYSSDKHSRSRHEVRYRKNQRRGRSRSRSCDRDRDRDSGQGREHNSKQHSPDRNYREDRTYHPESDDAVVNRVNTVEITEHIQTEARDPNGPDSLIVEERRKERIHDKGGDEMPQVAASGSHRLKFKGQRKTKKLQKKKEPDSSSSQNNEGEIAQMNALRAKLGMAPLKE